MVVVLRYVNEKGHVIESFISIEHVACTTALSLKAAIDGLFSRHGLSMSRLHGQGYDGASNMQGEFNGLKTLIMKENECAFYVYCFTHQLQLALVAVAKNHIQIASLLSVVTDESKNSFDFNPFFRNILQDKYRFMCRNMDILVNFNFCRKLQQNRRSQQNQKKAASKQKRCHNLKLESQQEARQFSYFQVTTSPRLVLREK